MGSRAPLQGPLITMLSNKTPQIALKLDQLYNITTVLYCKHSPLKQYWHHGEINIKKKKNKLRVIEAQIVQKLKNNEPWPKFTGSYNLNSEYKHNCRISTLHCDYTAVALRFNRPLSHF